MTPELKYKIERCGELLANSPLDEEIKKAIIDNFEMLTEQHIDGIIESLEREAIELAFLTNAFAKHDVERERDWNELAAKQSQIAEDTLKKTLQELNIEN